MPRRWPILLVGVVAFVALCAGPLVSTHHGKWFSGWSGVAGIEDKIEADARAFLANLGDHEVTASGQDLTVISQTALAPALQTDLGHVDGVRSVDFQVAAPAPAEAGEADDPPTPEPAEEPAAEEPAAAVPAPTEQPVAEEPAAEAAASNQAADDEARSAAAAAVAALDLDAVTFEIGTAVLAASAQQSLDGAAAQLAAFPGVAIEVQGHTDATGDPDVNLLLSQDRAEAVVDYLVSAGIDRAALTPKGYGGSRPVADNSTAEGQTANRRVELVVAEGTN